MAWDVAKRAMIAVADYTGGVEKYTYNYYEDLTPESAVSIVQTLAQGKMPEKVGSQIRNKAEPVTGTTTLNTEPTGPNCRDLAKLKKELKRPRRRRRKRRPQKLRRRSSRIFFYKKGCLLCKFNQKRKISFFTRPSL